MYKIRFTLISILFFLCHSNICLSKELLEIRQTKKGFSYKINKNTKKTLLKTLKKDLKLWNINEQKHTMQKIIKIFTINDLK